MSFVIAIGVGFAEKIDDTTEGALSSLPSPRETFERCERRENLIVVSPTIGCCETEAYDQVDDFIHQLTAYCTEYNRNRQTDDRVCYFIAVCRKDNLHDDGPSLRAQMLLTHMLSVERARWDLPVSAVITAKTYAGISPKYQDNYRPSTEIQGIKVHQRFREGVARCFVISPIGEEGSPTRKRADEVFETYIKPACDGTIYRAVRGEMMGGGLITRDIEDALQNSPMVIAYLGSPKPGWNPNVMYEYGFRRAFGLPVVVLKDSKVDGKTYELPFDLKDQRVVDLEETTPTVIEDVARKIRTIRLHMEAPIPKSGLTTIYPSATIGIVIPVQKDKPGKYLEASTELEALFELKDIPGRSINEVINHLAKKMSHEQCNAFLKDQQRILGNFIIGMQEPTDISANVPILFEHHTTLRGRAYLPIIASHLFLQTTSTLRLNVVYIEVTLATRKKDKEKCFECTLIGGVLEAEAD